MQYYSEKKKKNKGFTLVEMLMVVMILLLMTGALITGLTSAVRVYNKVLFHSNSGVLEDSIDTAFAGLTRTTSKVEPVSATSVTFFTNMISGTSGSHGGYVAVDEDGVIWLRSNDAESLDCPLVNTGAYLKMKVSITSLKYDDSDATLTGKYTISSDDGKNHRDCDFKYKALFAYSGNY